MGRSDSIALLQSDEAEVEREARSSQGAFGSLFSRWWPTNSADEAYDLGLPRVEEDYMDSDVDASGRLSDKPSKPKASMTSPAEKRKNQFAKKTVAEPLHETEGLDASQRDLYRRQMEAMRRLGLTDVDLSNMLAEDVNNSDADEIVHLPPVNNPITTPGNTNPAPNSLGSNSSAPKMALRATAQRTVMVPVSNSATMLHHLRLVPHLPQTLPNHSPRKPTQIIQIGVTLGQHPIFVLLDLATLPLR